MLKAFFTIVYFLIFCFLIDLIFRNTLSVITDMLAVICWIIALIISVVIADYTVEKIKENYGKK
ncbi:unknown [Oscillibacter sp. CAG:155]|jgi:TM2 domain-containing membrane protein YozV|nr:unknown [Oscillibacter sp. CAG:155]